MKQRAEGLTATAVLLCIEIVQRVEKNNSSWDVVLSRAGTDNVMRRTWRNTSGRLGAAQAEDLTHYVQRCAMDALVAWGGIQGTLPVE